MWPAVLVVVGGGVDTRAFLRVSAAARVHAREGAKALWDGRRGLETNEVYAVILHLISNY